MSLATALMGGRSTTSSPCRSELPLRPPLAPSCSLFVFGGQDLSAWSMPRSSHHTVAERVMWISQPSLQAALTLAALFLLPSLILFRSLLHSSSSTLHASSLHRLHHLLCPRYHDTTAVGVLWGASSTMLDTTVGARHGGFHFMGGDTRRLHFLIVSFVFDTVIHRLRH